MIIRDVPHDIENYYIADEYMSFVLHQKGFQPKYMDGNVLFFKLNNKLRKFLESIDVEF